VGLTFEETTQFYARKAAEEGAGRAWVAAHPEIQQLLHDFTAAVLREKPDDVRAYAVGYFGRYSALVGGGDDGSDGGKEADAAADGKEE